ncbi:MAG: uracil-DNA glycosylase [Hyphomicrobiaceae bacterium]
MEEPKRETVLAAVLDWYAAVGVDTSLGDEPVDWLARGDVAPGDELRRRLAEPATAPAPLSTPSSAPSPAPPRATPPGGADDRARPAMQQRAALAPDQALMAARETARTAADLAALEAALASFDGCGLKATAKNLCFFRGAAEARLMIVGEAPGRDEDIEGRPFVGRAGQLLDRMLAAIGLAESEVHITNIVYWRPPGNRTPTPQEAEVCRPFLERQIELVKPEVVLLLGGAAAKHMLGVADGIMRLRGSWRTMTLASGARLPAMATLHPAYLLRTPVAKRMAWRDLLAVEARLSREADRA